METLIQTPDTSSQTISGTEVQASMPITGMTCAACAISAESIVANTPGELGPEIIGTGIYPRITTLSNQKILSLWESDGKIVSRILY